MERKTKRYKWCKHYDDVYGLSHKTCMICGKGLTEVVEEENDN